MNFWNLLQSSASHIVARVRAAIMAVALSFGFYAKELAEAIGDDVWTKRIKIIAVGLAIVAMCLRAGQKNDEPPTEPKP